MPPMTMRVGEQIKYYFIYRCTIQTALLLQTTLESRGVSLIRHVTGSSKMRGCRHVVMLTITQSCQIAFMPVTISESTRI